MNANTKPKYQPWNQDSFAANPRVRRMTATQRWIYRTLLQEAFVCSTRPRLPDDDDQLWMLADCEDREQWMANKDAIVSMFDHRTIDGRELLSHHRLEEDWQEVLNIREAKSNAGKKSGESRKPAPKFSDEQVFEDLNTCSQELTDVPEIEQVSKEKYVSLSKSRNRDEGTNTPFLSLEDQNRGPKPGQSGGHGKSLENGHLDRRAEELFVWVLQKYPSVLLSPKQKDALQSKIETSTYDLPTLKLSAERILNALDLESKYTHPGPILLANLIPNAKAVLLEKERRKAEATATECKKTEMEREAELERARHKLENPEEEIEEVLGGGNFESDVPASIENQTL